MAAPSETTEEMSVTASNVMVKGNTAVVTGASSGIGRSFAEKCASLGMNVWLLDIDAKEVEQATEEIKKDAAGTIQYSVTDVSKAAQMQEVAEKVFKDGGKCNLLINNAGIASGGGPLAPLKTFERTLGVNLYGPINGCQAFTEKMIAMGEPAIIINTGSKQGITMPPGNLVYNTSKAALKCYTEGLEHYLRTQRREKGAKVRAALCVPGWVNSALLRKKMRDEQGDAYDESKVFFHEKKPADGAWMSMQVVDFTIQELNKGLFYILCPDNDTNRVIDNARMAWTLGDLIEDRPPLSRWHPDYKDKFTAYLEEQKKTSAGK